MEIFIQMGKKIQLSLAILAKLDYSSRTKHLAHFFHEVVIQTNQIPNASGSFQNKLL